MTKTVRFTRHFPEIGEDIGSLHSSTSKECEPLLTSAPTNSFKAQTLCVGWVLKGACAPCPSIGGTRWVLEVSWHRHLTTRSTRSSLFWSLPLHLNLSKWAKETQRDTIDTDDTDIQGSTGWIAARFATFYCNRFGSFEKVLKNSGADVKSQSMNCQNNPWEVFTWPSPWASRCLASGAFPRLRPIHRLRHCCSPKILSGIRS